MTKVISIKFKEGGKAYYFDPADVDAKVGDSVIVEMQSGKEMGTVFEGVHSVEDEEIVPPLRKVLRIATERDFKRVEENHKKEADALKVCEKLVEQNKLEMKLVRVEYSFDGSRIVFFFTADGRVDFRELVKDLATHFHTRIELRQIGVRDESKVMGSVGVCGRGLCCSSWLEEFVPVSIKMAKEQGLSLNPSKISGACGRLMCCLKYEQEAYEDLIKNTPGAGVKVRTPDGDGVVESVALLQGKVRVVIEKNDEKTINEYFVDQVERIGANNEKLPEEEIN